MVSDGSNGPGDPVSTTATGLLTEKAQSHIIPQSGLGYYSNFLRDPKATSLTGSRMQLGENNIHIFKSFFFGGLDGL